LLAWVTGIENVLRKIAYERQLALKALQIFENKKKDYYGNLPTLEEASVRLWWGLSVQTCDEIHRLLTC
jgi:hypothetical protein